MNKEDQILDVLAFMQQNMATKADISSMATKADISAIRVDMENNICKRLDVLEEGHAALLEKLVPRDKFDDLQEEVMFIKKMCFNLQDEVAQLKKAK